MLRCDKSDSKKAAAMYGGHERQARSDALRELAAERFDRFASSGFGHEHRRFTNAAAPAELVALTHSS
jgi:hypothetical protein